MSRLGANRLCDETAQRVEVNDTFEFDPIAGGAGSENDKSTAAKNTRNAFPMDSVYLV